MSDHKSPYRQFNMPVNLNMICADYLSQRNSVRVHRDKTHDGIRARTKLEVDRDMLDLVLGFTFQDRVGGRLRKLSNILDEIDLPSSGSLITSEWYEAAADEAIDKYWYEAADSVNTMNQSISDLTRDIKAKLR